MAKTMRIAFPRGGTLPADIAGGKEKKVPPHEPVTVPHDYGMHLVSDRFAYEAIGRAAKPQKTSAGEPNIRDLEKAVADARAALDAATDLDAKGAAQAMLEEAERKLAEATAAANG
jgi:hypothetical protein